MTYSIVMTTCSNEKQGKKISDVLLKKKLAACVKMSKVKSSYWWKGKIQRSNETLVSVITRKKNVPKIMSSIKKAHSYDTPEIIEVPMGKGDKKYERWICDVTG